MTSPRQSGSTALFPESDQGPIQKPKRSLRFVPLVATLLLLLGFLSLRQFLVAREGNYRQQLILREAEMFRFELQETLRQTSLALSRYATRVEYLGSHDKNYLALDSKSYLNQLPILTRIGLTDTALKVIWSYPDNISGQVLGFDQSKNEVRLRAFEASKKLRAPSLSQSVELRSGGLGFILPVPMFKEEKFIGVIYGTIEAAKLFQSSIRSSHLQMIVTENRKVLFQSQPLEPLAKNLKAAADLEWGLARLKVVVVPTEHFVAETRTQLPQTVLLLGSLFSFIMGAFLHSIFRSRESLREAHHQLELKVQERTEKIAEAKRRIYAVVSNMDAILFSTDKEGIFTFSEGKGLSTIEVDNGARIGKSIYDVHKDRPEILKAVALALTGQRANIRHKIKDLWHDIYFEPTFDELGNPNGLTGVAFNVDTKVRAENALTQTQNRLKTVLKHVPFAFWAVDLNRRFIFREGIGMTAVGMMAHEMIGKSIDEVYQKFPHVIGAMNRAYAGESFEVQTQISERWYNVAFAPSFDEENKLSGITGITFDITTNKLMETEKTNLEIRERTAHETSRLKSEFLANMSHEIRTPINGVIGMTNLILDTPLNPEQKEYAESVRRSADTLLVLINDILDFSKIEAGKLDFEEINFNLPEILEDTIKSFSYSTGKKGIKIQSEIALDIQKWVKGDPGRFRQVLNNLIGNAIKFTKKGYIQVKARSQFSENHRCIIYVEIEDSGIGIPNTALNRLFKAFSQADASTTRRFGGTGLGLSISKHLVENMGGTIGVKSEEGKGSTFWFQVSLLQGEALVHLPTVHPLLKSSHSERVQILVAEDNLVNQVITLKMLEKMGLKATAVANGLEALDALRNVNYDLILMDCQMPEMDGFEATREIRNHPVSEKRKIPIIAMTANAMKGDEELCLAAGMDDYVSKPISVTRLSTVVHRWLAQSPTATSPKKDAA